jgi:hypothetical protein
MNKTIGWLMAVLFLGGCTSTDDNQTSSIPINPMPIFEQTFDLHFVVLTKKAQNISMDKITAQVDTLNQYFVSEQRQPVFNFKFKSVTQYAQVQQSDCHLAKLGDVEVSIVDVGYEDDFNDCYDPLLKDPKAINVYIYDSYLFGSFKNAFGVGLNNDDNPFILLDYARLPHIAATQEHEMGHAFGLEHICSTAKSKRAASNIMASAIGDCASGSKTGLRNIGFSAEQIETIGQHGAQIFENLRAW